MIGQIGTLTVPNDQPWTTEAFRFWRGNGRSVPLIVTDAEAYLRSPTGARIDLTLDAPQDNEVGINMDLAAMQALVPGSYGLEVQYTDDVDDVRQLRGTVVIVGAV